MTSLPPGAVIRFSVRGQVFGLALPHVSELAELPALQPVIGAPVSIAGLADIRGRVVTVVDLAALVPPQRHFLRSNSSTASLDAKGEDRRRFAVIMAEPFGHLALLADGDVDIVRVEGDEPPGAEGPIDILKTGTGEPQAAAPPGERFRQTVLSDGSTCLMIDAVEVVARCSRQIRDRYRLQD